MFHNLVLESKLPTYADESVNILDYGKSLQYSPLVGRECLSKISDSANVSLQVHVQMSSPFSVF